MVIQSVSSQGFSQKTRTPDPAFLAALQSEKIFSLQDKVPQTPAIQTDGDKDKDKAKKKNPIVAAIKKIYDVFKKLFDGIEIPSPEQAKTYFLIPDLKIDEAGISSKEKRTRLAKFINNPLIPLSERKERGLEYQRLLFSLSADKPIIEIPFFLLEAATIDKVPLAVTPVPTFDFAGPYFDNILTEAPDSPVDILRGSAMLATLGNRLNDMQDETQARSIMAQMEKLIDELRAKSVHFMKNINNPFQLRQRVAQSYFYLLTCLHGDETPAKVKLSIAEEARKDGVNVKIDSISFYMESVIAPTLDINDNQN